MTTDFDALRRVAATPKAPEALTYQQKLDAMSLRYYQGMTWAPKAGDHYTTSRADLELYQVVSVDEGVVRTRYCDSSKSEETSSWPVDEFTAAGFGPKRVFVPDFVLRQQPESVIADDRSKDYLDVLQEDLRNRATDVTREEANRAITALRAENEVLRKERDRWKSNCQSNAAAMALVEEAFGQILHVGVKSGDHRSDPEPITWAADVIDAMHTVKARAVAAEPRVAAATEGEASTSGRHKDTERNLILNRAVDQIERAVNHHDPETDIPIKQGVWDIIDNAAATLERRILSAFSPDPDRLNVSSVTLTYCNWRGDVADRTITPRRVWFGSTEWHPEPQWLLTARDTEKNAERDFALADFMGRPDALATRDGKMRARGMIKAVLRVKAQATVCAKWTSRGLGAPVAEEQLEDAAAAIVELAKKEAGGAG